MRATTPLAIALGLGIAAITSCRHQPPPPYGEHPYFLSRPRCHAPPEPPPGEAAATSCTARPEVRAYLEAVKGEVYEAWRLPPGVSADQRVTVRIRIGSDGAVQCLSMISAPTDLAYSALSAFEAADPFPAMPSQASCLADIPVVGTFSNPVRR